MSRSPWSFETVPGVSQLGHDEKADVCIVGGGIAGLMTAYSLLDRGRDVVIIDDGPIGAGETRRTSAHLTAVLDRRYADIERMHGEEAARAAAESHSVAIDAIEALCARESIDCAFDRVDGYLFAGRDEDAARDLEDEVSAASRAGLTVRLVDRAPVGTFDTGRALKFPNQGQIDPAKFLAGLVAAIRRMGGRLYVNTHATGIDEWNGLAVKTSRDLVVESDAVVIATNSPFTDLVSVHTKQAAYRTYVIGVRALLGDGPGMLLWDTGDPYHYVRQVDSDFLLIGGEDHKTGQDERGLERFDRLEKWARDRFAVESVECKWSGQVLETVDGLAFIGQDPGTTANVFIATGFSGNGLTNGTIAASLLSDLIEKKQNAWEKLYDPSRVTLRSAPRYVAENANTAVQYADWLIPDSPDHFDEIAPDEGTVVQCGLSKVAAYRDEKGALHTMSAVCPHLGCVVAWNAVESSWDCPCHGSRFDRFGSVINGPANVDLEPVDVHAHES